MAKVVIDAGHGGYDSGAVNGTRYEKNDNLKIALSVGQKLEDCGVDVIYTRDTDVFIPLIERSNISNRNGADLFVSFHRNSSTNLAGNGVETWVYTNPSNKSVQTATNVQDALVSAGVQSDRGVQYGNFSVLRETSAPAILIELGFISNTEDNRLFDANFNAYVDATTNGILKSLGISCGSTPPPTTPPTTPPTESTPVCPVRRGDRSIIVKILQRQLNASGYPLTADGIFGANTETAVRNFQRDNGLTVDGIAGKATFEALFD